MAIIIKTDKPEELLKKIKKAIDDKSIDTWEYDNDGDFTHSPDQWKNRAWFTPKIHGDELQFGIIGQNKIEMTKLLDWSYHGRFIEMMLVHFDLDFSKAFATALTEEPDRI